MIIETAIDGVADFIVTGDSHLLTLEIFSGVKVITVEEMLAYLQEKKMPKTSAHSHLPL